MHVQPLFLYQRGRQDTHNHLLQRFAAKTWYILMDRTIKAGLGKGKVEEEKLGQGTGDKGRAGAGQGKGCICFSGVLTGAFISRNSLRSCI